MSVYNFSRKVTTYQLFEVEATSLEEATQLLNAAEHEHGGAYEDNPFYQGESDDLIYGEFEVEES